MKTLFYLLCLSLSCFEVRSQTGDSLIFGKFDLGFTVSPDYGYRILKARASDSWMKEILDTMEISRFGYTTGFNVVFHADDKLFLSSGIQFTDRGEKTKEYKNPPVNNYVNHYYYLSVPLKANYYLLKIKKAKLFLSAGISADIYLTGQSDIRTPPTSGSKKPIALSSKVAAGNLLINGGLGIDCPVTDRWYFKIQPDYRVSIIPVANTSLKKYFYSVGLNMGFFCRL